MARKKRKNSVSAAAAAQQHKYSIRYHHTHISCRSRWVELWAKAAADMKTPPYLRDCSYN